MSKTSLQLVGEAMTRGAVQVSSELLSLVNFIRNKKMRNVMEIGSEAGGTFWLWCQMAQLGGIKISVDKPDGSSGSGRFVESDALSTRIANFQSFAPRVEVITGDSHSSLISSRVRTVLGNELLDFLFLDGDHSCEGIKQDFNTYREFVRRGGLIAFHDIKDSEFHRHRGCFVSEFWRTLAGEKKEFCSGEDWGGIGVLEN